MHADDPTLEYRRNAVRGASSVDLVIMLYDLLLERLQRVASSFGNVNERGEATKRALAVLEVLQGTLDMEHGGDSAVNMDRLYSLLRMGIVQAHAQQSLEQLKAQTALLSSVRSAWVQARDAAKNPQAPASSPQMPPQGQFAATEHSNFSEWSA